MIDQVTDVLVVSKFVPVASYEMNCFLSSTRDSSIVIGMSLIGRYFRWLRIPLNVFCKGTVCNAHGGTLVVNTAY